MAPKKAVRDDQVGERAQKPIVDQMTDLAAQAAGSLAETAVRTAAKQAKKAVGKRLSGAKKSTTSTLSAPAKAPKRTRTTSSGKRRNSGKGGLSKKRATKSPKQSAAKSRSRK